MNEAIDTQTPHIIDALMALTGLALARNAEDLAIPMFEAARRFRPGSPRIDSFEGWFCLMRGDLLGATRHLRAAVDALGPEAGSARTLLAMVNCAQGDPVWLTQAQTVIDEGTDPSGVQLMLALRDGQVAPQESPAVSASSSFADSGSPTPAAATNAAPDQRRFVLRG